TYDTIARDKFTAEFTHVDVKNAMVQAIASEVDKDAIRSKIVHAVLLYKRDIKHREPSYKRAIESKSAPLVAPVFEVQALLQLEDDFPRLRRKSPSATISIKAVQVLAVRAAGGGSMNPPSKAQFVLEQELLNMDVIFFCTVKDEGRIVGHIQGHKAELDKAVQDAIQRNQLPRRIRNQLRVLKKSQETWVPLVAVKQLYDNRVVLNIQTRWRGFATTRHYAEGYVKPAIGDLIKQERRSFNNLRDNALAVPKLHSGPPLARITNFSFSADDEVIQNDPARYETLFNVATGRMSNPHEFCNEGAVSSWKNLRILLILSKSIIKEDGFLGLPVAIGDRDSTVIFVPRSKRLENVIKKVEAEGFKANKKMAVIELRWVDASTDANLGDANAEFVFTAFTKAIWRKPDRETTSTRIDIPPAAKPDILRAEAEAQEGKRVGGSYQLVNGLKDLPDTNRFNSMFMLQGSEDEKRQDLFNTTSMLFMNVKTPFTAMGREEIEAEDKKKPRLFSAGANIKAKGEWKPSP
ncbi:hypothetical protein HDU96_002380, partial [Phlyctochytrium bullatum]